MKRLRNLLRHGVEVGFLFWCVMVIGTVFWIAGALAAWELD